MRKYVEINGVNFELQKNHTDSTDLYIRTIYDLYERPSQTKVSIYDFWENWFSEMGSRYYEHGCSGGNCNFFTYHGYFEYEGIKYYARITYAHNYLYIVD